MKSKDVHEIKVRYCAVCPRPIPPTTNERWPKGNVGSKKCCCEACEQVYRNKQQREQRKQDKLLAQDQQQRAMRRFGSKLEFTSWQLMKKRERHFAETVNAILDPLSPVKYVPMRRKVKWKFVEVKP